MPHSADTALPAAPAVRGAGPLLSLLRRLLPWAVALLVASLAVVAAGRLRAEFDLAALGREVATLPAAALAGCVLLTLASYTALVGYDLSALRWIGARLPLARAAMGSFIGFAFSNTLSFTAFSGGAIRYRLYTSAGLSGMQVAKAVFFLSTAFMVGISLVGSVGLWLAPERAAAVLHLPPAAVRTLAMAVAVSLPVLLLAAALWRRPLVLFGREITLPGSKLLLMQLVISTADIAFSAGALYVLLPADTPVGFAAFAGVYCAAIVLGLLSHLPGGIGVFDGIMVLALADAVPAERMGAALLVYRAVYYLLPLLAAVVLLAGHEGRALRDRLPVGELRRRTAGALRLGRGALPAAAATVAVAAGIVLLVSGALPAVPGRVHAAAALVSLPVVEVSHILNSVVGLGLVLIGRGLYQRLDSAWTLTMGLLGAGIVLNLLKGLDWEEAVILAGCAAILWAAREEFYRRGSLTDVRLTPGWVLGSAGLVAGAVVLTLFAFEHVEYRDALWWQVATTADAPRSMRALVATGVALLGLSLHALLRPAPRATPRPDAATVERAAALLPTSPRTEGNLVLLGDKAVLFNEAGTGFLMYGVRGRSWVAMGDPVGPVETWPDLVWSFRQMVHRHGGQAAFYQVRPESLPLYLDAGLLPVKIGEEARVPLAGFDLEGPERRDLRYAVRKGGRDGLSFALVGRDEVPALLDELRAVSDGWLAGRKVREKGFSVGWFDPDYLGRFDHAVVRHEGRIVAFANIWAGAPGGELSVDLMRHRPDAPPLTMDFLFAHLMLWGAGAGFSWFNLGMAPLSGLTGRPLAPLWHRLGAFVFTRGEPFYGFRGLRQYKEKFHPRWEPRYLCSPGGLAPATILADVAALVAGGLDGTIGK